MSGRAEALAIARAAVPYFQEQWEVKPNQTTRARLDSALRTEELLGNAVIFSDEAVERAARVLVEVGRFGVPWDDASDYDRAENIDLARAVIAALGAAA